MAKKTDVQFTESINLNIIKADNGGYIITSYNAPKRKCITLIAKTAIERNAMVKKLLGSS